MSASPSNSGILRNVGDVVLLERNPDHDAVGVKTHGDADGAELAFEGSLGDGPMLALEAEILNGTLQPVADGRFAYIIKAPTCNHVRARLTALQGGSIQVALYSGDGESMKLVAGPIPAGGAKPKPSKMNKPEPKDVKSPPKDPPAPPAKDPPAPPAADKTKEPASTK